MNRDNLKVAGIACLVLAAFCAFVAVERYQANASNIQAMRRFIGTAPMFHDLKPGVPVITKYAAFFAILSGIGGFYCLRRAQEPRR